MADGEEKTEEQLEEERIAAERKQCAEDCSTDAVNFLVDAACAEAYERYLKRKEAPYSAQKILKSVYSVVDLLYLKHDQSTTTLPSAAEQQATNESKESKTEEKSGEASEGNEGKEEEKETVEELDVVTGIVPGGMISRQEAPENLRSWICDDEPEPSKIDSWARGTVPVRRRIVTRYPADFLDGGTGTSSKGDKTSRSRRTATRNLHSSQSKRSTTSRRSKGSAGTRATRADKSGKKAKGGKKGGRGGDVSEGRQVVVQLEKTARFRRGGSPAKAGGGGAGSPGSRTATPNEQGYLRQLEERERLIAEKREGIEREQKEEEEKFERIEKEMKGRDYVLDAEGNPVAVNLPKGDRLPPMVLDLKYELATLAGGAERSSDLKSASVAAALAKVSMEEGKGEVQRPFFTQSTAQQPSLLSVISLKPGVKAKENEQTKAGPNREEDPSHQSLEKYKEKHKLLETRSLIMSMGEETQTLADMGLGMSMRTMREEKTAVSSPARKPSAFDAIGQVPEIDMAEGGQRSLGATMGGGGGQDGYGDVYANDDLALTKAADWGAAKVGKPVPASLPRNRHGEGIPTLRTQGGESMRERPFISKGPKTRLPPPPLGKTMGHGLMEKRAPLNVLGHKERSEVEATYPRDWSNGTPTDEILMGTKKL